jgi:hypothetical protein
MRKAKKVRSSIEQPGPVDHKKMAPDEAGPQADSDWWISADIGK